MIFLLASAFAAPDDLVWTGIDYSLARLVGTADFHDPSTVFPALPGEWNAQFLDELTGVLSRRTGRSIRSSVGHLPALHEAVASSRTVVRSDSIRVDQPFRSAAVIQDHVRSSVPAGEPGMGLTFIVDQLNKPARAGCYWVTFFDTASLDVLSTTYRCGEVGGIGFRSAWFGTVKSMMLAMTPADVPTRGQVAVAETTIRIGAQGLSVLDAAGIPYTVVGGGAPATSPRAVASLPAENPTPPPAPAPLAVPASTPKPTVVVANAPEPGVVVAAQPIQPAVRSTPPDEWPAATCPSVAGKTVCGFNCAQTETDVACAQDPGERCTVEDGVIVCTDARRRRLR